jgi:large subunit ribosomal protein L21e
MKRRNAGRAGEGESGGSRKLFNDGEAKETTRSRKKAKGLLEASEERGKNRPEREAATDFATRGEKPQENSFKVFSSMKRSHGKNVGRSRNLKSKGRLSVTRQLAEFKEGERVRIDINPSFDGGMPHLRFNHRQGQVIRRQGKAVIVAFYDGNKRKELAISNIHLAKA